MRRRRELLIVLAARNNCGNDIEHQSQRTPLASAIRSPPAGSDDGLARFDPGGLYAGFGHSPGRLVPTRLVHPRWAESRHCRCQRRAGRSGTDAHSQPRTLRLCGSGHGAGSVPVSAGCRMAGSRRADRQSHGSSRSFWPTALELAWRARTAGTAGVVNPAHDLAFKPHRADGRTASFKAPAAAATLAESFQP